MRVAILDGKGRLVGAREVDKPKKNDVDCGDLPADGSYFFRDGTFIPKGFGNGKVQAPGVNRDRAMFLLIRAMVNGTPIPQECRDWADWYERHNP